MLSLLSYNIFFGLQLDNIINWINKKEKPYDLICFQEFPENDIHRINELLPKADYSHIYSPGIHVRKKTFGELTLYNSKRIKQKDFSIVNMGYGMLEKQILRVQSVRTTLIGHFSFQGKPVIIANTHLTMLSHNNRRLKQLENVLSVMKQINEPSIILGDFNYSSLFSRKKLFSLMSRNEFTNAIPKHKTHKLFMIKHQLDYVFYKKITIYRAEVNHAINFSDHFPITLEFEI